MRSRVHPTYKTKYHVSNWAEYDRSLVRRGDIPKVRSEPSTSRAKTRPAFGADVLIWLRLPIPNTFVWAMLAPTLSCPFSELIQRRN